MALKKIILCLQLAGLSLGAQTKKVIINANINLPKDSLLSINLISSLDSFLIASQFPHEQNKFVLPSEKLETFVLLDELEGIEKNEKFKDDHFFKPYLTNVLKLTDSSFQIKVMYLGVSDNQPMINASFNFIATKNKNGFLFSSPMRVNTVDWCMLKVNNNTF
jgi:hypothetical protein